MRPPMEYKAYRRAKTNVNAAYRRELARRKVATHVILGTGGRPWGHDNKRHRWERNRFAGRFSIKVVEMSTESKREGGYVVHLAQQ